MLEFLGEYKPDNIPRPEISLTKPSRQSDIIAIDAGKRDIEALQSLSKEGVHPLQEDFKRDEHLWKLVEKPWGQEYRVYADDFLDIWQLRIDPGQSTSMHAHPRKVTYLLCLSGSGKTRTMKGDVDVKPGIVLAIGKGAFHATACHDGKEPLVLIEVETPRNKFDLVRLSDNYARRATAYETVVSDIEPQPKPAPGLSNSSLCPLSPCKRYAYNVHTGMDVFYRRHSLGEFLIPIGLTNWLHENFRILTAFQEEKIAPLRDGYYLGIKSLVG